VTTAQTSALAIAATAANGTAIAARLMPVVSSWTPPVSDAVRSLTERFNEAGGEAAQKILLHKAKFLRLTAEEKTAFLQGVRDRGALVVDLISRFRGTSKGAKRKEKRKAIWSEVDALGLTLLFKFTLSPISKLASASTTQSSRVYSRS
jgi:hypothetical protein